LEGKEQAGDTQTDEEKKKKQKKKRRRKKDERRKATRTPASCPMRQEPPRHWLIQRGAPSRNSPQSMICCFFQLELFWILRFATVTNNLIRSLNHSLDEVTFCCRGLCISWLCQVHRVHYHGLCSSEYISI
jgi:hypothetical protein